jgi:hypothetical protein
MIKYSHRSAVNEFHLNNPHKKTVKSSEAKGSEVRREGKGSEVK